MKANVYAVEMAKEWRHLLNAIEVFFKCSARLVHLWLRLLWRWFSVVARGLAFVLLSRPRLMKRVAPGKSVEVDEAYNLMGRSISPPGFGLYR